MKLLRKAGSTSEIWQIFIRDSSSTTGGGLTGLTNASSGLTAYYHRETDTTAVAISLVSMTVGTFTSSGFKEIDSTNMPGWYQFCPPNAALASGAKSCGFHLKGVTNMAPVTIEVDLQPDVNVTHIAGTAQTARDIGASVLLSSGTGTGQVDLTSGVPKSNLTQIMGTVVTQGVAGRLAAAFSTLFDVASPVLTVASVNQTGDSFARIGASGAGLTSLAPASTALSTAQWTNGRATLLDNLSNLDAAVSTRLATAGYTAPTNLTAAQIATGVWQDTTPGDFTVASSIGKSLYTTGIAPGAASGIALVGSSMALTSGERTSVADAMLDQAAGVETNRTVRQSLRLMLAALVGKLSGAATTTVAIRDTNDTKTRISATVDADGNRSVVTLDGT